MATVWLLAAANSSVALAQHVSGGMGEEVRMGAFDARGAFDPGGGIDSRPGRIGPGSLASGKSRAHTHARTTDARGVPTAGTRGSVPVPPGRHLP